MGILIAKIHKSKLLGRIVSNFWHKYSFDEADVLFFRRLKSWLFNWWDTLLVITLCILAFSHFFILDINMSDSLPGTLYLISQKANNFSTGDIVTFKWYGRFYPKNTRFTKIIAGIEGDLVSFKNGQFYIQRKFAANAVPVGHPKAYSKQGEPLAANSFRGLIPKGKFWVMTPHKDSYDSRYADCGLVSEGQIVGKAFKLW